MNGWTEALAPLRGLNERIRKLALPADHGEAGVRIVWRGAAILGAVACGFVISAGDAIALVWGLGLAGLVLVLARAVAPREARGPLIALAALAISLHLAVAASIRQL